MEINFNSHDWNIVNNEVEELLLKGAIINSVHEKDEFISNIFIVPKPNGKFRPILNLRKLNQFVEYNHFKQETFNMVLDIIQVGDYFTKIDLCDAYFAVPIHQQFQKFLKFYWNNVLYKMVCLPFGLSSAPYIFTKILKPIFAWFRLQNIRCSYYIDDSINMNPSYTICESNGKLISQTLVSLGFTINHKKSVIVPCQRIVFFGFIIDSVEFKIFLTEEKIEKIEKKAKKLISLKNIVVRDLASFIGLVINAFYAVFEAPLYYRNLERDKIFGLGHEMNFENNVQLSDESRHELEWWLDVRHRNGKNIRQKEVEIQCRTDASLLGYGGYDIDSKMHCNGRWKPHESDYAINYLELLAIFFTLRSLYHDYTDVHIQIQCDNVSAIAYINDLGGMTSVDMDRLAKKIWTWCIQRRIFISAVHIKGTNNVVADFYSRNFPDSTEWKLKKPIFDRLYKQLFTPDIDLFASRLNKQLEEFVSWFPEPGAKFSNAFSKSWKEFKPLIFPPFNLIGKVLIKIKQDEVDSAILIFPYWHSMSWYPLILECLSNFPIRLPRHKDLLTLPHNGMIHPMRSRLRMIAAEISGKACKIKAFHKQLQNLSYSHGPKEQENSIEQHGINGIGGIVSGLKIHFVSLK